MEIDKINLMGMTIDVTNLKDKGLLEHLLDKFEDFKWFARMYAKDYELKLVDKK